MDSKDLKDLREKRKQWFSQMEQKIETLNAVVNKGGMLYC